MWKREIYKCFFVVCVAFDTDFVFFVSSGAEKKDPTRSGSVMATTLAFTARRAAARPRVIDEIDAVACTISISATFDASMVATTYGDGNADVRRIGFSPGTPPSKPIVARYL